MKRVLLVVALLGLSAYMAWGQTQNLGTYYKNPQSGQVTDGSGNAYVNEYAKDRDNWIIYTNAINDTISNGALVGTAWTAVATAAGFCVESTAVYPSGAYRKFAIGIRLIPASGDTTTSAYRLAVQIRGHSGSTADSSNTFYWESWSGIASAGAADTSAAGTSAQSGNLAVVWPGEKVIAFDPRRGNVLTFGQQFGAPAGKLIDLVDAKGNWFWAPYMSVRVRVIGGTSSNAAASKGRIVMSLMMGS